MILILCVFLVNIFIHLSSKPYRYNSVDKVPQAQTALILGASVYSGGELSSIFKSRVDMAINLYETGKVSKILASGDNSSVYHNEVNPVRDYLLVRGIPDKDIFLDHAGFDTYSTMYRARDIFQVASIIVVTQNFHLPRSVFIARILGIKAYGISANNTPAPFHNYVREIFADEKAMIDLVLHRKPKFLGDTIPITGTQQNYIITTDTPKDTLPVKNSSSNSTLIPLTKQTKCFIGGCSNEICSDKKEIVSSCIYKSEYACYKTATCELQSTNECGWSQTPTLTSCLNSAKNKNS